MSTIVRAVDLYQLQSPKRGDIPDNDRNDRVSPKQRLVVKMPDEVEIGTWVGPSGKLPSRDDNGKPNAAT